MKENINFWEENVSAERSDISPELISDIDLITNEIQDASLCENSSEVASTIAGYITRKLLKRSKCDKCKTLLIQNNETDDDND